MYSPKRKISYEEFKQNLEAAKKFIEQDKGAWIKIRKGGPGGIELTYMTWTKVYNWVVKTYDNDFTYEVLEISPNWVKGKLTIGEHTSTLALKIETYESVETLQMRVFVKLVANLTGFGLHLWMK